MDDSTEIITVLKEIINYTTFLMRKSSHYTFLGHGMELSWVKIKN